MLFNSFDFFVFFIAVTGLYFAFPHKARWPLLLAASCLFYMTFIPVYILILAALILIDYLCAIMIDRSNGKRRKAYLLASILATCAVLFVFKYFNFFNENIALVAKAIGWNYSYAALSILLPVGLSFHTFQSLSYVIEVYRGKHPVERHLGIYALYVMFYPQLVAGPIERPQNLLHQFRERHAFNANDMTEGLKLMLWGLFKKMVVADRIAAIVGGIFASPKDFSGSTLFIAAVFFTIQIYADFSGYSDIALGAARTMGFRLMINFRRPFAAKSIAEFWRRWHISLTSWFQDYIFTPLYLSFSRRKALLRLNAATRHLVAFILSILIGEALLGLWHGANWTYIIFGVWHGTFIAIYYLTRKYWDRMYRAAQVSCTFLITVIGFVFFRARSVPDALYILWHALTGWSKGGISEIPAHYFLGCVLFIVLMLLIEWAMESPETVARAVRRPALAWNMAYGGVLLLLLLFGAFRQQVDFVYFQF